jgi:DNA-binding response OmpR family regulator
MTQAARSHRPTALVVEDEALISLSLEDVLAAQGYRVLTATTCDEALRHLDGEDIDMALIDYWLRTQRADDVAIALRDRGIPFAICTGALPDEVLERFPETVVLGKPFEPGALETIATRLLGSTPAFA